MILNSDDISSFEQRYRATFLNSLSGFKPVFLLGTISLLGIKNLSLLNSVVHIGSSPFLLGFILRPLTVTRHSYDNLKATNSYSLNAVTQDMIRQAHHASAKFEENVCEFESTGLTPQFISNTIAPCVSESPLKMTLEPIEEHLISNGTILIIGQVTNLLLPDELVSQDGFAHLEKASIVSCLGLDAYYKPSLISRYEYARPHRKPETLSCE